MTLVWGILPSMLYVWVTSVWANWSSLIYGLVSKNAKKSPAMLRLAFREDRFEIGQFLFFSWMRQNEVS